MCRIRCDDLAHTVTKLTRRHVEEYNDRMEQSLSPQPCTKWPGETGDRKPLSDHPLSETLKTLMYVSELACATCSSHMPLLSNRSVSTGSNAVPSVPTHERSQALVIAVVEHPPGRLFLAFTLASGSLSLLLDFGGFFGGDVVSLCS